MYTLSLLQANMNNHAGTCHKTLQKNTPKKRKKGEEMRKIKENLLRWPVGEG